VVDLVTDAVADDAANASAVVVADNYLISSDILKIGCSF
jgi:hypothetical protein